MIQNDIEYKNEMVPDGTDIQKWLLDFPAAIFNRCIFCYKWFDILLNGSDILS